MAVFYSRELADEICERLAAGAGLATICRDAHMPSESSVRQWVDDDRDGFAARYVRAREMQAEHWASEIVDISDSVRRGSTSEEVQAARLAVDSRKWIASKVLRDRYGERVEHVGAGGKDLIPDGAGLAESFAQALMLAFKTPPKAGDAE